MLLVLCLWIATAAAAAVGGVELLSHAVGVETRGGVFTVVVVRYTALPVVQRAMFSSDRAGSKTLRVFVGNRLFCRDNRFVCGVRVEESPVNVTIRAESLKESIVVEAETRDGQKRSSCQFSFPDASLFDEEVNFELEAISEARDEDELSRLNLKDEKWSGGFEKFVEPNTDKEEL
jgi:hypothetical protein